MPLKLTYDDNHIRFLDDRNDVTVCPTCSVPTHPFDHGFPNKEVPKAGDLTRCFEGFALASPRFKNLVETKCTSPIQFFETGGGYFIVQPIWSVFEDFTATGLSHGDLCESCGRYNSSYGTSIGVLADQREIGPLDLVRTENEVGPKNQKNFRLLAGEELVDTMKAEGMIGIAYLNYRDEFVAEAVLRKAAALDMNRLYKRSAQMYQDFIDDFSTGVPLKADRHYLVAYAEYHRYKVGRKIGRKHYPETPEDQLKSLGALTSRLCLAKFPIPS